MAHGPVCPHCGVTNQATLMRGKSHRPGLYQCNACREPFTVTVGALYERSHVPLNKWLAATHLMIASKKGISVLKIGRMLGLSKKTAGRSSTSDSSAALGFEDIETMTDPNSSDDEGRVALYQAIGEATTAWAGVEDQIATLFVFFVAGRDGPLRLQPLAAKAAFYAVINFNSRLAMADSAADWTIWGQHRPVWITLRNRVSRQAKRRNEIAHFSLIRSGPIPNGPLRYYLSPSLQNVNVHLSGKPPPRLSAADLKERAESFRTLARELYDFAVLIGAAMRQELLPGFGEAPSATPN